MAIQDLQTTQEIKKKQDENEKMQICYNEDNKEIKEKVNKFIREQDLQDKKESEIKKKIFAEFREFIDVDLNDFMSR